MSVNSTLGNKFFVGVENSTEQSLVMALRPGTSNLFTLRQSGSRELPNQPFFSACLSQDDPNRVGMGSTVAKIKPDLIIANIGSHYKDGTFTAPQKGVYLFTANVWLDNVLDSALNTARLTLKIGEYNYKSDLSNPFAQVTRNDGLNFDASQLAFMNAGDTASLFFQAGIISDNTVGFKGSNLPDLNTCFSGYFLG